MFALRRSPPERHAWRSPLFKSPFFLYFEFFSGFLRLHVFPLRTSPCCSLPFKGGNFSLPLLSCFPPLPFPCGVSVSRMFASPFPPLPSLSKIVVRLLQHRPLISPLSIFATFLEDFSYFSGLSDSACSFSFRLSPSVTGFHKSYPGSASIASALPDQSLEYKCFTPLARFPFSVSSGTHKVWNWSGSFSGPPTRIFFSPSSYLRCALFFLPHLSLRPPSRTSFEPRLLPTFVPPPPQILPHVSSRAESAIPNLLFACHILFSPSRRGPSPPMVCLARFSQVIDVFGSLVSLGSLCPPHSLWFFTLRLTGPPSRIFFPF